MFNSPVLDALDMRAVFEGTVETQLTTIYRCFTVSVSLLVVLLCTFFLTPKKLVLTMRANTRKEVIQR
jgi:hypothetical protein